MENIRERASGATYRLVVEPRSQRHDARLLVKVEEVGGPARGEREPDVCRRVQTADPPADRRRLANQERVGRGTEPHALHGRHGDGGDGRRLVGAVGDGDREDIRGRTGDGRWQQAQLSCKGGVNNLIRHHGT